MDDGLKEESSLKKDQIWRWGCGTMVEMLAGRDVFWLHSQSPFILASNEGS
jgi:hypothetical protein